MWIMETSWLGELVRHLPERLVRAPDPARECGEDMYVSDDVLLEAIRSAIDRSQAAFGQQAELQAIRQRYLTLSAREREVMALVVSGLLNKQVAAELGISEITVKAVAAGQVQLSPSAAARASPVR